MFSNNKDKFEQGDKPKVQVGQMLWNMQLKTGNSQAISAIPRQKLNFAHCIYSSTESHVEKYLVLQFMLVIAPIKEKPQQ